MIGDLIFGILSSDSAVTDLVDTKIYPILFNQKKTWPGVVYQVVSGHGTPGKSEGSCMDFIEVQIDSYSSTPWEAGSIALAIRQALENLGPASLYGVQLSNIEWLGTTDGYTESPRLYRKISKYLFTIKP